MDQLTGVSSLRGGGAGGPQQFCSCNEARHFQAKFILLIVHLV